MFNGDDRRAFPVYRRMIMHKHHWLHPFFVTAAAIGLFSLMDALMKGASIAIGAYSALCLRSLIGTALIFPVWRLSGHALPGAAALRIHGLRACVACAMALLFFHGLTFLPLAEAIALSFIAPLIALYLAALLLKERIAKRAIGASLLGVAGIAIITAARLDRSAFDPDSAKGIMAVLGSAGLYAWNLVLQRRIAQIASPQEVALAQHGLTGFILVLFAPWFLVLPEPAMLGWIAAAAALATVSLMALAWAYARAEAQMLVPVEYSGFLWAILFGWLFFAETVSTPTLAGAGLITLGCWIAAPRAPPDPSPH